MCIFEKKRKKKLFVDLMYKIDVQKLSLMNIGDI